MSRINSRTKGHSFERLIAIFFRSFYVDAKRGLQSRDGSECSDVINTPFWIECKRERKVDIQKAYLQALDDSKGQKPILVVSKSDRGPVLVTMDTDTFKALLISEVRFPVWGEVGVQGLRDATRQYLAQRNEDAKDPVE